MRFLLAALILAFTTQSTTSPSTDIAPALAAEIARFEKFVADDPRNQPNIYVLAAYYDRAKDTTKVLRLLNRLDELGWRLGVGAEDFTNASTDAAYKKVAAKLDRRVARVHRAKTAFTFPKEVNSEGIAYDPVDEVIYLSGGKDKLLRVDKTGRTSELPIEPPGEKFGRLGMDVDAARRQIWVVNAVLDPTAPAEEKGRGALSVYDLRDGKLLRRVTYGSAEKPALLNDMTLLADGTALVTDSTGNTVLRLTPDATSLEVFAENFFAPNGITTSADARTLYVADFRGINAVDISTKQSRVLGTKTYLNGIDGLVEHRGTLIGVHNVLGKARIVRVHPARNSRVEILESGNPLLNVPSTGIVTGNDYVFLANRSERAKERVMLRISL